MTRNYMRYGSYASSMQYMIVLEIESPGFFDLPVEYLLDDEVTETVIAVLNYTAEA